MGQLCPAELGQDLVLGVTQPQDGSPPPSACPCSMLLAWSSSVAAAMQPDLPARCQQPPAMPLCGVPAWMMGRGDILSSGYCRGEAGGQLSVCAKGWHCSGEESTPARTCSGAPGPALRMLPTMGMRIGLRVLWHAGMGGMATPQEPSPAAACPG